MYRTLLFFIVVAFSSCALHAQAPRPQTPVEPFMYRVIDVTIPVLDEGSGEQTHTLGGTLTLPDSEAFGDGPYVGVVLMSGSGMQDRDSTIFEHKPFLVIADYLSSRGIAVLRYDDRLVGESTGTPDGVDTYALAHDGLSAARFMMEQEHVDPERVGLMGHSEGGMHVAYLAAENESIAFVISLAGMGVRGDELLLDQAARIFASAGRDEAFIDGTIERRRAIMDAVIGGEDDEAIVALIAELNMFEYGLSAPNERLLEASRAMLPQFAGEWMRSFMAFDAREHWKRVDVPALVINGGRDLQVDAALNLGAIRAALLAGGHHRHTILEFGGLNHLFQHAKTGMVGEYAELTETFAPEALALIEAWIRSQMGEGE